MRKDKLTINLVEVATRKEHKALIVPALKKDMPLKKDGWLFNWKSIAKTDGALLYKITLETDKSATQGMLMLMLVNKEMLFMNNIEVAPHNFGTNGQFDKVAGCLIAFASYKSFELGKGNYQGYLLFESKTALLDLYQSKYGATVAMGQRMFIDKEQGKKLIKQYLNLDI